MGGGGDVHCVEALRCYHRLEPEDRLAHGLVEVIGMNIQGRGSRNAP